MNSRVMLQVLAVSALLVAFAAPSSATQGPKRKDEKGHRTRIPGAVTERIDVVAPVGGVDLPAYTRTVLPNGLVVLLMERAKDPLVHMRLTLRSGSAADPPGKEGLASLTSELLTAGTRSRTAEQIATEVDFVGGTLTGATDCDTTTVTSEFLAPDMRKQLDLVADVTLRPVLARAEVERVRRQRLAQLSALTENPRAYADAQFSAALFAGTRYAHPAAGLLKAVESITPEDVTAFHRANYVGSNAVLAVVGSFKTSELVEMVRGAFGGWERGEVARAPFGTPQTMSGRRVAVVDFPNMNQTQVRIGAIGIARNDPDYDAIQVANTVLSSGFSSRLVEEIRVNRSLTYGIGSSFAARMNPGPYIVSTFTKNATTREIIDAIFGELKKFREGPTREDELTRAKNMVLARTTLQLETAAGLAFMVSVIEVYGLQKDYVEALAGRVNAITSASIEPVIRNHFPADALLVLVFTTAAYTRAQLEGLGPIEVRNYLQ